MSRVDLLRRFGKVEPWLADRVEAMTPGQWRLFYDEIEAGEPLPVTFEDTMPRSRDDFITNPHSAPEEHRAQEVAKWEAWKRIWGEAPWEQKQNVRARPRMPKSRD